jgi:hypothetical protein
MVHTLQQQQAAMRKTRSVDFSRMQIRTSKGVASQFSRRAARGSFKRCVGFFVDWSFLEDGYTVVCEPFVMERPYPLQRRFRPPRFVAPSDPDPLCS